MKTIVTTAALLAALTASAGYGVAATKSKTKPEPAPVVRGEMLARENCGTCHATGLKGDSPNPKSPPFRTLSKRYKIEALEEALAEGITMGHGEADMPHFIFEPDDLGDLIAYLKRINRQ